LLVVCCSNHWGKAPELDDVKYSWHLIPTRDVRELSGVEQLHYMLPRSAQKVTGPQFNSKRRNLLLTCNTYLTGFNVKKFVSGVNAFQKKNLGE